MGAGPRPATVTPSDSPDPYTARHKQRLAIDINLFKNGVYQTDTEAHRQFGDWWLAQDPDCRWGGNFTKPDGNHYSMIYKGIA